MFFKKKISLISPLGEGALIGNLQRITENKFTRSSDKFKFEGRVKNNVFLISPTFNYGPNALLRPEIEGLIKNISEENCEILLNFRLPLGFKILFVGGLILNIGLLIYLFVNPIEGESLLTWKFYLSGLLFTGFVVLGYFHYKIEKSINILSGALKAERN